MTTAELLIATAAAVAAGLVNALAGGGTLVSFPVLVALGVPPVVANITNAVALCPGYLGATLTQMKNLRGQWLLAWLLMPGAVAGGIAGALILVRTGERTFTMLVPWMIMAAALLLAVQERLRAFVLRRLANPKHAHHTRALTFVSIALAAIYGGFFSAGMSVLLLAVLGLTIDDNFTRLNALKQVLAFVVNVAAVVFFLWSGKVIWTAAAVMAMGALIGGALGGRLSAWIRPATLRRVVIITAMAVAIGFWMRM